LGLEKRPLRIGVRSAISGLFLTSILVSAIGVHLLWWQTAEETCQNLARTIDEQIVSAVGKELSSIATEARSAHTAIHTLFLQNVLETRGADKREFVFLSQLQSQSSISWIAFGWPDGAFFAAHKLGVTNLQMMEIAAMDGKIQRRVDRYEMVTGDIQFEDRRFEDTAYSAVDQEWFQRGVK
jgi:adenylate cyclase